MNLCCLYILVLQNSNRTSAKEKFEYNSHVFKLHMHIGLLMVISQWHNKCLWPRLTAKREMRFDAVDYTGRPMIMYLALLHLCTSGYRVQWYQWIANLGVSAYGKIEGLNRWWARFSRSYTRPWAKGLRLPGHRIRHRHRLHLLIGDRRDRL